MFGLHDQAGWNGALFLRRKASQAASAASSAQRTAKTISAGNGVFAPSLPGGKTRARAKPVALTMVFGESCPNYNASIHDARRSKPVLLTRAKSKACLK